MNSTTVPVSANTLEEKFNRQYSTLKLFENENPIIKAYIECIDSAEDKYSAIETVGKWILEHYDLVRS